MSLAANACVMRIDAAHLVTTIFLQRALTFYSVGTAVQSNGDMLTLALAVALACAVLAPTCSAQSPAEM